MRLLVVFAHPVETSFCAALHRCVVSTLEAGGHDVDDCDLHGEGFDPVLSRAERIGYHDVPANRQAVAGHVGRLLAAEGLVLVFPVWNFGFPAILKGWFDRVFLPGVSFVMRDGKAVPNLKHLKLVVAVTTYGGSRFRAFLAGDPPRRIVTRVLRATAPRARIRHHALYDMNRADDARRTAFLDRTRRLMEGVR